MAALRSFIGLTIVAFLFRLAMADNYIVGGADGWSLGTDFQTWASSQTFKIGDTLTFIYGPQHSVVEVLKDDYDACTFNNPIASATDGNSFVVLSSPGTRYFICGTPGHCAGGMKLEVDTPSSNVTSVPSQAPAATPESPTADSPPPPPPPPASDSPTAAVDVVPTAQPSADSSLPVSNSPQEPVDLVPTTSPSVDSPPARNSTTTFANRNTKPFFSAANGDNRQVKVELLLAMAMIMALVL